MAQKSSREYAYKAPCLSWIKRTDDYCNKLSNNVQYQRKNLEYFFTLHLFCDGFWPRWGWGMSHLSRASFHAVCEYPQRGIIVRTVRCMSPRCGWRTYRNRQLSRRDRVLLNHKGDALCCGMPPLQGWGMAPCWSGGAVVKTVFACPRGCGAGHGCFVGAAICTYHLVYPASDKTQARRPSNRAGGQPKTPHR